jgi:hypothetical protein
MSRLQRLLAVCSVLLSAGCINAATLTTARSLPPGDRQIFLGGGMTTAELKPIKSGQFAELGGRVGLVDGLEAGVHATLLGTGGFDLKYQFLDLGPLAVAAGLGVGYLTIGKDTETTTSGHNTTTKKPAAGIVDLIVPVYASWDVGSHLSAYSCVKYLFRYIFGGTASYSEDFAAGTLGIKLGDAWGLLTEGSFVKGIHGSDAIQANAVVFWSL